MKKTKWRVFQAGGIASAKALKRDRVWWADARRPVLPEQSKQERKDDTSKRYRGQFVWCLLG